MTFNIEVYDFYTVINIPFKTTKPVNVELLYSNLEDLVRLGHINLLLNFSNKKLITDKIFERLEEIHNLCTSKGGKLRIHCPKNELEMISYLTDVYNISNILSNDKYSEVLIA